MKITPLQFNQLNPSVTNKCKKVKKIVEEFDRSMFDAYKVNLDPGEYANLHSAYSAFHQALVRMHRDKSIQVRTSSAEQCVYLIRTDISKGGTT